jgi:hypothetical protein
MQKSNAPSLATESTRDAILTAFSLAMSVHSTDLCDAHLGNIADLSLEASQYLAKAPVRQWAISHLPFSSMSVKTSNYAESFFAKITPLRQSLSVFEMFQETFSQVATTYVFPRYHLQCARPWW